MHDYYDRYNDPLDVMSLKNIHLAQMAGEDTKSRDKMEKAYDEVEKAQISDGIDALFKTFRITDLRFKVEEFMDESKFTDAQNALEEIAAIEAEGDGVVHENESIYMELDLEALVTADDANAMRWFMPKLDEIAGVLTKGTSTLILARSNAGKTSFIVPEVVSLLAQGFKGVHVCLSEDGREELAIRYAMGAFRCTQEQALRDKARTTEALSKLFDNNLKIINTGRMSARDIEKEYERMEKEEGFVPDFAVYDQYQKMFVKANSSANTAEVRTEVAQKIKDMAAKFGHHAICATQADQSSGWTVTEMNVDGSKTGVVGEFKTIIGLGKEDDDRPKSFLDSEGKTCEGLKRNVNVAKNKGKLGAFEAYLVADKCYWEEM